MVNKTVEQPETGSYFHKKTKRKQTCSATPGDCVRNTVPSKGRSDCAYKCINNTEEVRKALGGRRCLAFNFSYKDRAHDNAWENPREDNSAFCEVSSRAYWSGQWHGSGPASKRRFTTRIKDDRPNRPPPTDKRKGCYAEVYELGNFEHWNRTASEGKDFDFEDYAKNRNKSLRVKGCVGTAAVAFWNEDGTQAFLTSDTDMGNMGETASENKISKIRFYPIPTETEVQMSYDQKIFGLVEGNSFDNPDAGKIIDKSRRDKIPIAKGFNGDPCPGGSMFWKDPENIRCIYNKADFDAKARALAPIVENAQEPISSQRKAMYEDLVNRYCNDTSNYHKIIGVDGKKCSQVGDAQQKAVKYCKENGGERIVNEKETCNLELLGESNFDDIGTMYCSEHPEDNFCDCYNTVTRGLCDRNPDAAGCADAMASVEDKKDIAGESGYKMFKDQKHCFICPSSDFVPQNAMKACGKTIQICNVETTIGQAVESDFAATCELDAKVTEENQSISNQTDVTTGLQEGGTGTGDDSETTPTGTTPTGTTPTGTTPTGTPTSSEDTTTTTTTTTGEVSMFNAIVVFLILLVVFGLFAYSISKK
jgi:hypothetical protein